jgi:acetolactate synthase regulatory subunit
MSHHQFSHRLQVVADADSTILTRICGLMTTLGLIPLSLEARLGVDSHSILVEIVLAGASPRQLDLLRRKLGQMIVVDSVVMDKCQ